MTTLLAAHRDWQAAERKVFELSRRLEVRIWMDIQARKQRDELQAQVAHWIGQTERAEAVAKAAVDDRDEALGRIDFLEREMKDLERSRDDLIGIADKLRAAVEAGRDRVRARR